MIVNCLCHHDFQDQRYGPGRRVANPLKNGEQARCTVCKTLIRVPRVEKKEETKT